MDTQKPLNAPYCRDSLLDFDFCTPIMEHITRDTVDITNTLSKTGKGIVVLIKKDAKNKLNQIGTNATKPLDKPFLLSSKPSK